MKYFITQNATYQKKVTPSDNLVMSNVKAHYNFVDNNGKKMTMDLVTVDNIPDDSKVINYSQFNFMDCQKPAGTFYVTTPEVYFKTDYKIDEGFNKNDVNILCNSFNQHIPVESNLGNDHYSSFVQFDMDIA